MWQQTAVPNIRDRHIRNLLLPEGRRSNAGALSIPFEKIADIGYGLLPIGCSVYLITIAAPTLCSSAINAAGFPRSEERDPLHQPLLW